MNHKIRALTSSHADRHFARQRWLLINALAAVFLLWSAFGLAGITGAEEMDHGQMEMGTPAATDAEHNMAGMDMEEGGHDMGPVDATNATTVPTDAQGNQPLVPTVVDGVKEYQLTTSVIKWSILPDVQVTAFAYNEQVPGPLLRLTAGDPARINVTNNLPEPTSVHWHGLVIPNEMDGAAGVTQPAIEPGETFAYEFTVPNTPGTYFYHTHFAGDKQQAIGLYGTLLIDSADQPELQYDQEYTVTMGEWLVKDGETYPAMDLDGMLPNYFTINGKSYPETDTIQMKVGETALIRFIGTGQFIHPMHIHGGPFKIVGTDGNPVPEAAQLTKDTVLVGPGERYDVLWTALEPGTWLIHCHINHHITNDGAEVDGAGGLTMVIEVTE